MVCGGLKTVLGICEPELSRPSDILCSLAPGSKHDHCHRSNHHTYGLSTLPRLSLPARSALHGLGKIWWSAEAKSRQYRWFKGQVSSSCGHNRRLATYTSNYALSDYLCGRSLTGAAEAHKGEAVENEASNFVNGIATAVMATSVGKAPESDADQSSKKTKLDTALPDPTALTMAGGEAKGRTAGELPTEDHNKAKDPMVDAIWKGMRPLMHGLEDFCDNYERMGK